jgi:hypothetical protein
MKNRTVMPKFYARTQVFRNIVRDLDGSALSRSTSVRIAFALSAPARVDRHKGAVTRRPLPHHRAYGSVHGGSSWLRKLPVPCRAVSARARGLRPRRVQAPLALARGPMWPSAYLHSVGTLEGSKISRLNTRPTRPLSRLRRRPRERRRMTRRRCGSLGLHRLALSSVTPRRF